MRVVLVLVLMAVVTAAAGGGKKGGAVKRGSKSRDHELPVSIVIIIFEVCCSANAYDEYEAAVTGTSHQ